MATFDEMFPTPKNRLLYTYQGRRLRNGVITHQFAFDHNIRCYVFREAFKDLIIGAMYMAPSLNGLLGEEPIGYVKAEVQAKWEKIDHALK